MIGYRYRTRSGYSERIFGASTRSDILYSVTISLFVCAWERLASDCVNSQALPISEKPKLAWLEFRYFGIILKLALLEFRYFDIILKLAWLEFRYFSKISKLAWLEFQYFGIQKYH